MSIRTTQTTIHFPSPFALPGFDAPQPPGDYRVDHDEEAIESISRLAWRRVGAFIHLPAISVSGMSRQMVPVTTAELEAALTKDSSWS